MPNFKHVVLLIHGIRTRADWAEMVMQELEVPEDTLVIPIRYGYFDLLRFLLPGFTRRAPVTRVLREIRGAKHRYPAAQLSIVAHSYGTYAISRIVSEESDIRIRRLILCGSVIPTDFRWDLTRDRILENPLNDCGTNDIWPLIAAAASWGYGPSGVFGFGSVDVCDRFHPFSHSDYFSPEFVREFWRPYIVDGVIVSPGWERSRPTTPAWRSILPRVPLQWSALAIVASGVLIGYNTFVGQIVRPHEVAEIPALAPTKPEGKLNLLSLTAEQKELVDQLNRTVVYFDFDRSDVTPEFAEIIHRIAQALTENPGLTIEIGGHTDEREKDEDSLLQGGQRALAVKKALLSWGASDAQIYVTAFGKSRPEGRREDDEATWAKNRRATVRVLNWIVPVDLPITQPDTP